MISIMVNHFDYKHRCLIEKNVPIVLILPSRWQYGAESLGIEHTSCLCCRILGIRIDHNAYKINKSTYNNIMQFIELDLATIYKHNLTRHLEVENLARF